MYFHQLSKVLHLILGFTANDIKCMLLELKMFNLDDINSILYEKIRMALISANIFVLFLGFQRHTTLKSGIKTKKNIWKAKA